MNLLRHPELVERLAAAYALGTLRGGARRRFESLAREQAPLRAAALVWQARLSSMAELQAPVAPPAAVWTRIENVLRAEREAQALAAARTPATPAREGWWHSLTLWRTAALAGVALAVAGLQLQHAARQQHETQVAQHASEVAALRAQLAAAPQIRYVAVLADERAIASILATYDASASRITLQRVGTFSEPAGKSLQLWALPEGGAAPRSLGVLGPDRVLQLPAAPAQVDAVPALAISLEPLGGVPEATGPTGPVLFKGALLRTSL
jgi:anti-sigma-K factor RskA